MMYSIDVDVRDVYPAGWFLFANRMGLEKVMDYVVELCCSPGVQWDTEMMNAMLRTSRGVEDQFNILETKEHVLTFFASESWTACSTELAYRVLSYDKLAVSSEEQVFDAWVAWSKARAPQGWRDPNVGVLEWALGKAAVQKSKSLYQCETTVTVVRSALIQLFVFVPRDVVP